MDIVAYEDEQCLMGRGRAGVASVRFELTYSCIYVYISVYFYLELMEGQRNRAARVLANPFRQRALDGSRALATTFLMVMPSVKYRSTALRRSSIEKHADSNPTPKRPTFRLLITGLVGLDGQGLLNMVMGCCIPQCSSPLLLMNNVVIYIGKCVICYRTQH